MRKGSKPASIEIPEMVGKSEKKRTTQETKKKGFLFRTHLSSGAAAASAEETPFLADTLVPSIVSLLASSTRLLSPKGKGNSCGSRSSDSGLRGIKGFSRSLCRRLVSPWPLRRKGPL